MGWFSKPATQFPLEDRGAAAGM